MPEPDTPLTKLRLGPQALVSLREMGLGTVSEVQARYPTPEELAGVKGIGPKVAAKIFGTNPPEATVAASSPEPPGVAVAGDLTPEELVLADLMRIATERASSYLDNRIARLVAQSWRTALDEFRNPAVDA